MTMVPSTDIRYIGIKKIINKNKINTYNEIFINKRKCIIQISKTTIKAVILQWTLKELYKISCGSVSPRRIINKFCSTQRTCLLAIEPFGHTSFTENVMTLQQHRCRILIVTYWTIATGYSQLFFSGRCSQCLKIKNLYYDSK